MMKLSGILNVAKVFTITGKYLLLAQKNNSNVVRIKQDWSHEILKHFKIELEVIGSPATLDSSCILIGNHISYLDIPVVIQGSPDVVFVSKNEVRFWPVIGNAAVKMETIFVQRKKTESRASAKEKIAETLLKNNKRVVIFPSGTTSVVPSARWQKGVFEIAGQNSIRIQPFRLSYHPLRESAYIDKDNLLIHMYKLFQHNKIKATLEFHKPVNVEADDCDHWKSWCEHLTH